MRYRYRTLSLVLMAATLLMTWGCDGEDLTTTSSTILKRRLPSPSSQMEGGFGVTASPSDPPVATASATPSATPTVEPTPDPTPEESPTDPPDAQPDPTPEPSPTPEPTPTATPTPEPSPTPTPGPTVLRVVVSPSSATLNAGAPSGSNASGFVSSLRLSATVTMSDGSTHSQVAWASLDPQRVVVAPDGTVRALATATPGEVSIIATAVGSTVSGSATVTVTSNGRVNVIVE